MKSFNSIIEKLKLMLKREEYIVIQQNNKIIEEFMIKRTRIKKGENPKLKGTLEKAKKVEENNLK